MIAQNQPQEMLNNQIIDTERPPLVGWQLMLARGVWIVSVITVVSLFVRGIPLHYYTSLVEIPIEIESILAPLGLGLQFLAGSTIFLSSFTMLIFVKVAIIIFWHKSDDWFIILLSLTLLFFGATATNIIYAVIGLNPITDAIVLLIPSLGLTSFFAFLCLFPDGRFVPGWTRWITLGWATWSLLWLFFPSINIHNWPEWLTSTIYVTFFSLGVLAQFQRNNKPNAPIWERQTRWTYFGLGISFIGFVLFSLPIIFFPRLLANDLSMYLYHFFDRILSVLTIGIIPVTIMVSILHERLWNVQPFINRTLVYLSVTGFFGIIYFGVVVVAQQVFILLTGKQSDLAVIVTTLLIAFLFQPVRDSLQRIIDRSFYRERRDFQQSFLEFSRELSTMIDLDQLLEKLVTQVADLFHITHTAVFLRQPNGEFKLAEAHNLSPDLLGELSLGGYSLDRLQSGAAVFRPKYGRFRLLVPLTMPKHQGDWLMGVLALGPRLSEQGYSFEDQALLKGLADQAGTAIYVAQLIQEKQEETQRKEVAKRQLETYQNSPLGRAEILAQKLVNQPEITLEKFHHLAQKAGYNPDAATFISNLPKVLHNLDVTTLAGIAEGYNYLYNSRINPEVLLLGLRRLVAELQKPPVNDWPGATTLLLIYKVSEKALKLNSVAQISALLNSFDEKKWAYILTQGVEKKDHKKDIATSPMSLNPNKAKYALFDKTLKGQTVDSPPAAPLKFNMSDRFVSAGSPECTWLAKLVTTLGNLSKVAEAVHAYERVETVEDKLAYLASAVDHLQRINYIARTDLGGIDQVLIQRIVENWLAVITEAMSDLQTRAKIVARLLTRHTWQGEIISIALSLRNEGQGTAFDINVKMLTTTAYTPLTESECVEQLAAGEETEVTLRVRPHVEDDLDHFRVRFSIEYADPRGPDQVHNFADIVYLLTAAHKFQFIPNPYVVGTPLQTDSSLFFGRENVITGIKENLAAGHRNNLVLIGQRRTGKTSLLKQLPAQLENNYVAVYIDGQALGLDPGLPNFFLALATEIVFAIEDAGYTFDLPELEDFTKSPAATFEYTFLPQIREILGERHLLILLDEFEELEIAVQRGNLDSSIFGFLRHLIQHSSNLSVIFCGTHRLEELAADYWNVLFNISLYRQVGFLTRKQAMALIQEPVSTYGLRYDDLALEKIWRVTAGHPYFLQLLCHSLVNQHNRTERNYMTVADVNTALDDILASGEAHFVYLWAEADITERMALVALSRMMPLTGQATALQIVDYLVERGIPLDRWAMKKGLHNLALREIVQTNHKDNGTLGEAYRWKLGLLGLWVEKYKSLSRVVEARV